MDVTFTWQYHGTFFQHFFCMHYWLHDFLPVFFQFLPEETGRNTFFSSFFHSSRKKPIFSGSFRTLIFSCQCSKKYGTLTTYVLKVVPNMADQSLRKLNRGQSWKNKTKQNKTKQNKTKQNKQTNKQKTHPFLDYSQWSCTLNVLTCDLL